MLAGTITHRDRKATTGFLNRLYPIPDPNETMGEFERYHNIDLCGMPLEVLRSEERKLQSRLDRDERPSSWLWGRLEAVRQEIARHHESNTQERPLPVQGLQQPPAGTSRPRARGIPLAIRRIGIEGGHD